jgi:hypothetical protein
VIAASNLQCHRPSAQVISERDPLINAGDGELTLIRCAGQSLVASHNAVSHTACRAAAVGMVEIDQDFPAERKK